MRRIYLLLFLTVFSTLSLFSSGVVESQDGLAYLSVARNIYYEHKAIAPPYEFDVGKNIHMNVSKGRDGNYYSPTGIGYSLAMLPAVATSDILHRLYKVEPPSRFPLESDWSVLLFSSFVNPFFAGLLAVYICAYSRQLGQSVKFSVLTSIITIFCTNLFPLAKHGFAHMMFITTMMGTFLFIRKYFDDKERKNIIFAALNFGVMVIAYGPVYFLTFPAFLIHYLVLSQPRLNRTWALERVKDVLLGFLTLIPFALFYFATNAQKSGSPIDSGYGSPDVAVFRLNWHILYEGTFGLLLSPGRGFFWYSPLALIPIIFWHKLVVKKYLAEISALALLGLVFVYFHAMQNSGMNWLSWNGESSWGPRYIAVLIPFFGIISGVIIAKLKTVVKMLIIAPILVLGLTVQMFGVLMPYQIKFRGLLPEFKINETRFTTADYANFIPRYSPLISAPRNLITRIKNLKPQFDHGQFDVRFFDGVDFPFDIAGTQWRGLRPHAYISVNGTMEQPLKSLRIGLANVPVSTASAKAIISMHIAGEKVDQITLASGDWGNLEVDLHDVKDKIIISLDTRIEIEKPKVQAVFIRDMEINGQMVPLRSLDFPYTQPLAKAMTNSTYLFYGQKETDPWQYWYLRSQVYEETLDLWWLKSLYYWDLPHPLFGFLFLVFSETALIAGILLVKQLQSSPEPGYTNN